MSIYFLHYRIKNYHHIENPYYYNYYNDPKERSLYLVPLYIIVVAFPVFVASSLISKAWEKKAALLGYLVSLHK